MGKAAATAAVMICSPTSVKALVLKTVETLHLLSLARPPPGILSGLSSVGAAISGFGNGLMHRFGVPGTSAYEDRVGKLRAEAGACAAVCGTLRRAALLVDEVRPTRNTKGLEDKTEETKLPTPRFSPTRYPVRFSSRLPWCCHV